ncbi:uncharacterized protein CPUR_03542 [Claviceps purpurea 20.1]|uniref:Uncharacterized protein n=1 Tax=Claviceps purpurea (strain 20.1) TaxID=1111077 RepID=M1W548_CLAP2|nr:uncharacterized protein CPUR_03542 [Claviceps purpurea 20.1]
MSTEGVAVGFDRRVDPLDPSPDWYANLRPTFRPPAPSAKPPIVESKPVEKLEKKVESSIGGD